MTNLPFGGEGTNHQHGAGAEQCSLQGLLPPALQERTAESPHLLEYLHRVPIAEVGVPEYYPELNRKLGDLKHPNLIYPVPGDLFVHIFPDVEDARDYYISIEPSSVGDLDLILEQLERRLMDYVEALERAETPEAKAEVLRQAVRENCAVTSNGKSKRSDGKKSGGGLFSRGPKSEGKIPVTAEQLAGLEYLLVRDKIGLGILEPMIHDPYIEDISCSGLGRLFIEHKVFKGLKSTATFDHTEALDEFVIRLSEKIQKPVTYRNPIVDATLPDGSRINIVYGSDVSKRGSNFSIRKFTLTPLSIVDLVSGGSLNSQMAGYLWLAVSEGMNVFVSGETASGKTTVLNAISGFIQPWAKIVSIEDTPELQVPHPNWIREVVRGSMSDEDSSVTMFSLLKAALRQRPNAILVGEIRGEEGAIAFQAMQTGHASMATFHAASVGKLVQRLTNYPISVPKTHVDNLNASLFQSAVHDPKTGRYKRRVIGVNEILGYEPADELFNFVEVFSYNAARDNFEFRGFGTSFLLDAKIATMRGYEGADVKKIYVEMYKRAEILEFLLALGIKGYQEVVDAIQWVQNVGVDAAHSRYKRMCLTKFGYEIEQKIAQKIGKPPS